MNLEDLTQISRQGQEELQRIVVNAAQDLTLPEIFSEVTFEEEDFDPDGPYSQFVAGKTDSIDINIRNGEYSLLICPKKIVLANPYGPVKFFEGKVAEEYYERVRARGRESLDKLGILREKQDYDKDEDLLF